jgi:hypothetical protein
MLDQPWLKDAKVTQDRGINMITRQRNDTIHIIIVTFIMDNSIGRLKTLLCYDFQNGIIDEEKDFVFKTKI